MVFSDLALSRRLERAEGYACAQFAEARRRFFPDSGAEWIDYAGAYAAFDGIDSPVTQSFGLVLFGRLRAETLDVIDGHTGADGTLCIRKGGALFAGAATIPSLRRRGLQAALLGERMRYAFEQGCDLAMMVAEAGSSSQRNAERKGFQIAYTRTK